MTMYTRTGMLSHRHPFHGTSYMSSYEADDLEQMEAAVAQGAPAGSIWDVTADRTLGTKEGATTKPLTQTAVPVTPDAPVAGKMPAWLLPALVGGAVLVFMLMKKK